MDVVRTGIGDNVSVWGLRCVSRQLNRRFLTNRFYSIVLWKRFHCADDERWMEVSYVNNACNMQVSAKWLVCYELCLDVDGSVVEPM